MIRYWICAIGFLFFFQPLLQGQADSFSIELKQGAFSDLVDLLEKEFDVNFSYRSDLLNDQEFYLKTNATDLTNILDEIVALHDIEYQLLNDKSILLRDRLSESKPPQPNDKRFHLTILDSSTKMPLETVAVGIKGTTRGDYSDESGKVTIDISQEGQETILEVQLLGYQRKQHLILNDASSIVYLKPLEYNIDEVMIHDRQDAVGIPNGAPFVEIRSQHLTSLAGGVVGEDILRQVQLLPGLAAYDDKSAGLKIRGADEASALVMLDDIPIYNASHYYGLFSAINPSYASTSTLYKNNLPISHDGKTSGMLQISGPETYGKTKATAVFDINLLTLSGAVTAPIAQNLSITAAARTTYQNISDTDLFSLFSNPQQEQAIIENFTLSSREQLLSSVPDFKYFDVNSKIRYGWDKGYLELNYYQSRDDLDDTFSNQFRSRRERVVVLNDERYSNTEMWENQGYNLKLENTISPGLSLSAAIYQSKFENRSRLSIDLNRRVLRQETSFNYDNRRTNDVKDSGAKVMLKSNRPETLQWMAGVEIVEHDVAGGIMEQENIIIGNQGTHLESSLFAAINPYVGSQLKLEIGLRGTLYNEQLYPAPRMDLSYQVGKTWSLKSSLGRHYQYVRQLSFENIAGRSLDFWLLAEGRVEVGSSDQAMIGATFKPSRWTIDLEAYYRKRYNLLEQALFDPRFNENGILPQSQREGNEYRLFTGDGNTLGLDIMIGATYPKYSGWIAYTLSKSEIQYDQILRGTSFPSQDDRTHQLKVINEYKIGHLTLGANIIYTSGRPYTDLNKVGQDLRRDELRPRDRISRLPDYIRGDLAVTYSFDTDFADIEVGLSVYNLLGRENVNYIQYLFSIPTNSNDRPDMTINTLLGTESNLLDRTVNLNLKLRF